MARARFKGFLVQIKDAEGRLRGTMEPDEFRRGTNCPRTAFLEDCVKRWNTRQAEDGAEDRAEVVMEAVEGRGRSRRTRRF